MSSEDKDETRLWIGHLDHRITEFQLLKILQKFGEIDKFDMLFHRSGPLSGQPRGYAFVTYKKAEDAVKALNKLHGQQIGIKYCSVRFAKNVNYDEMIDKQRARIDIPALAAGGSKESAAGGSSSSGGGGTTGNRKKDSTIQAIEAKLKMLESRTPGDDFMVNRSSSSTSAQQSLLQKYQFNLGQDRNNQSGKYGSRSHYKCRPYNSRR